MKDATAVK